MKTIQPKLIGRLGNCCFIYAHARALAEQQCKRFVCEPWLGEKLFDLNDERPDGPPDQWVDGYCQNQESLIYTRADCKRWFKFRPHWTEGHNVFPEVVCHKRRGDYRDLGYVVVSGASYDIASAKFGVKIQATFSDATALPGDEMACVDFWYLANSKVLFRGNSSFSWWAATLSNATVYSPVIDGLPGGLQECEFVLGNHPKLASLPNITDLHLKES